MTVTTAVPGVTRPQDRSHRLVMAAGLVASGVLLTLSIDLMPALTGNGHAVLARLDAAGWRAGASTAGYAVAQLFYVAAALGIGRLLRERAPRLGAAGTLLSIAGAFGHAVFGGISLMYVAMAHDEAHANTYAGLLDSLKTSPVNVFSLLGLAGFAVGLLLFSIGLFRGQVGPRWAGPAIWLFLVVEFLGGAVVPHASYVSSLVLLVVFGALAREVAQEG